MGEQTIKPRHNIRLALGSLLVVIVLLLAACGGSDDGGGNTNSQAPTDIPPTPRSTTLPIVPTAVVFGTSGDPIQFAFVSDDSTLFELAEVEEVSEPDTDEDLSGDQTPEEVEDGDGATDEPDVSGTEEADDGDIEAIETPSDVEETEEPSSDADSSSDEDSDVAPTEDVDTTDEPDAEDESNEDATATPAEAGDDETATPTEDADETPEDVEETATPTPEELGPEGDGSPRGNLEAQLNFRLANENQSDTLRYLGLSLAVEVRGFDNMREALEAVCGGDPTFVWVDAFTYIVAERTCGVQPLYAVRLSDEETVEGLPEDITFDGETGVTFDIVYNTRLGTLPNGLADLANTMVCRLGPNDPFSWIYFSLSLQSAGVNPITGLAGVVDVDDYGAMVLDILSDEEGTCQVGAIPHGTLEDILAYLADEADEEDEFPEIDLEAPDSPLRLLLEGEETWAEVPNMILIASPEPVLPAEFRERIVTSFDELLEDIDNTAADVEDVLAPFLRYEEIVAVDGSDFNDFRQWLQAARWQMGP